MSIRMVLARYCTRETQGSLISPRHLTWLESRREDKGKHGKFDFLWKGPYTIYAVKGNNAYFLKELDGAKVEGGSVNVRMLKHYIDPSH